MTYHVLTIGGSDPSGGAGIQADLKTIQALGCYGMSAITLLTAQNTLGVRSVAQVDTSFLRDQLQAIFEDIEVHAVKIGALGSAEIVQAVTGTLLDFKVQKIILDPVMVSKSKKPLLDPKATSTLRNLLLPLATLCTPNLPEASALVGWSVYNESLMERAAKELLKLTPAVLIKGGHLEGDSAWDLFASRNEEWTWFRYPRVPTRNTHGTGCTLSSAIASFVAQGLLLQKSVSMAREYLQKAIEAGAHESLGHGWGPVAHNWNWTTT